MCVQVNTVAHSHKDETKCGREYLAAFVGALFGETTVAKCTITVFVELNGTQQVKHNTNICVCYVIIAYGKRYLVQLELCTGLAPRRMLAAVFVLNRDAFALINVCAAAEAADDDGVFNEF